MRQSVVHKIHNYWINISELFPFVTFSYLDNNSYSTYTTEMKLHIWINLDERKCALKFSKNGGYACFCVGVWGGGRHLFLCQKPHSSLSTMFIV